MFPDEAQREAFMRVARAVKMTRFGGDCYSYCLLAMGQLDLVIEGGLNPYDIVPLIPIIEAAGGVVTDSRGGPAEEGGFIVAAGDAGLHEAALAIINE
jgi:myo-inositol-1(or 4)-monophosphatase